MKEVKYQDFSFSAHSRNWQTARPSLCQFELTFRCGLHCRHCYTDCYNTASYASSELALKQITHILDTIFATGVLWVCFTGGDPLIRRDFLDIYAYAKAKGFIITVFSNGYSMTREIAAYFKKKPPFSIEITLNAAETQLYEAISQVPGSFKKAIFGIELIRKYGLPLVLKSQITRDNFGEFRKLERFAASVKAQFKPSINLHARLNGDAEPCAMRLPLEDFVKLNGFQIDGDEGCSGGFRKGAAEVHRLFQCAVLSGDGFQIDPQGNVFLCNLLRKPSFNALKDDLRTGLRRLLDEMRAMVFRSDSECSSCRLRGLCHSCPGKAYLETGDCEKPVPYFCRLAKDYLASKQNTISSAKNA
ncbi:MAG: radical SAM protein [Candidatus Omnitrophica bacterium]|nr:radical SAM protein [Candidatus Omnitrophota bacterium]